ncbi:MerR family transcriptional regulator [Streptomyces mexicanus]|uniref:MerR family transcriptional regulator n=1 Tax=Streptomyces mexicanus TaxID=178566 RepID=UPI0013585090|nr:MerR family transcriptional regulator [Streptomyces mexicanus]
MRIGELARATGTTTRALRYYEEHGLLPPERSPNGYRTYPPDAVKVVENIRLLLAAGLTTEDLRLLGTCLRDEVIGGHRCDDPTAKVEVFEQRLAVIQHRIDELTAVRAQLLARLEDLHGRQAVTRSNGCARQVSERKRVKGAKDDQKTFS